MLREKPKWRPHKGESTDAGHRDGATRSSVEVSVMEMERRVALTGFTMWSTILWEEPLSKAKPNGWSIGAG